MWYFNKPNDHVVKTLFTNDMFKYKYYIYIANNLMATARSITLCNLIPCNFIVSEHPYRPPSVSLLTIPFHHTLSQYIMRSEYTSRHGKFLMHFIDTAAKLYIFPIFNFHFSKQQVYYIMQCTIFVWCVCPMAQWNQVRFLNFIKIQEKQSTIVLIFCTKGKHFSFMITVGELLSSHHYPPITHIFSYS